MLGSPPFLRNVQEQGDSVAPDRMAEYLDIPDDIPPRLLWEYYGYMAAVQSGQAIDRSGERLPCFWWNPQKKSCRHYRYRPKICRVFYCAKACEAIADAQ